MDGPARLFVYGTLMPGHVLWPELAPFAASWEVAAARGRLWDTGHGYPGVRFDDEGDDVPGVVVDLHAERAGEAFDLLDRIEDEGRLFRRLRVTTSAGAAFAYEWLGPVDDLRLLPRGWPPA